MAKNQQTIMMKLAAGTALDILGPEGLLWGADAPEDGRYSELFNFVRCMSIAGGSDEINKNVIGERALGLPREPNPDKGVPFREVLGAHQAAARPRDRPGGSTRGRGGRTSWSRHRYRGSSRMGRKYQVISGDGHLETPPDFVAFLPEKYKDRAPKLITLPDGGGDAWLMEGMPLTYASQNLRGRGKVKFAGQSYFKDDGSRTDGAGDGAPAPP